MSPQSGLAFVDRRQVFGKSEVDVAHGFIEDAVGAAD